jgi:hypothetical protein
MFEFNEIILVQQQHAAMMGLFEGMISSDSPHVTMQNKIAVYQSLKIMLEMFPLDGTEVEFMNQSLKEAMDKFEAELKNYVEEQNKESEVKSNWTIDEIMTHFIFDGVQSGLI